MLRHKVFHKKFPEPYFRFEESIHRMAYFLADGLGFVAFAAGAGVGASTSGSGSGSGSTYSETFAAAFGSVTLVFFSAGTGDGAGSAAGFGVVVFVVVLAAGLVAGLVSTGLVAVVVLVASLVAGFISVGAAALVVVAFGRGFVVVSAGAAGAAVAPLPVILVVKPFGTALEAFGASCCASCRFRLCRLPLAVLDALLVPPVGASLSGAASVAFFFRALRIALVTSGFFHRPATVCVRSERSTGLRPLRVSSIENCGSLNTVAMAPRTLEATSNDVKVDISSVALCTEARTPAIDFTFCFFHSKKIFLRWGMPIQEFS